MVVTVILFPPFSRVIAKEKVNIDFAEDQRVSFWRVLDRFRDEYPITKTLLPSVSDHAKVYGNLFAVRGSKLLLLGDEVFDKDIIKLYGSIAGG
ncbi:MAG: hypothetical protein DDT25_00100 [Chloroflexi bacterium]|nr:hypothetical protein [Chloroflexota bacterium]